jgi:23S rRNA G2445 N2-methylase RlmL
MEPFGLAPVRVETAEGRREYADAQRELMEHTNPLREQLAQALLLLAQCDEDAARLEDH